MYVFVVHQLVPGQGGLNSVTNNKSKLRRYPVAHDLPDTTSLPLPGSVQSHRRSEPTASRAGNTLGNSTGDFVTCKDVRSFNSFTVHHTQ